MKLLFGLLLMVGFATAGDTLQLKTTLGDMRFVLYENTPRHAAYYKARFQEGQYEGTLFTRVVKDFVIQGGALDSRNAPAGARVGAGSRYHLLMPEFRKDNVPYKGVLGAPRESGKNNPQKKSDASQFFIVQGQRYTSGYLDSLEMTANNPIKNAWWKEHYMPQKAVMDSLKVNDPKTFNERLRALKAEMNEMLAAHPDALVFTEEQRRRLTTDGGALHLMNEYTFFGEVVEGMQVIDAIGHLKTDANERPYTDVVIRTR